MNSQAAQNPAQDAPRPSGSALVIRDEGKGVVYILPKSTPNISSLILMFLLLAAIVGLPILMHFKYFASTPTLIAIAAPILSLIISIYLAGTILMELFGTTQVILTHGKLRIRQSLGLKLSFGCNMDEIRYVGLARSYAYKQSNADPVDLFYIKKNSWTRTALAVYQNPEALSQLLQDLKQRFPQYASRILTQPPEDPQINVVEWLKIREEIQSVKDGRQSPVHPGIITRPIAGTLCIRARNVTHRFPSWFTHPLTCAALLAALFALGTYHVGIDKTLSYAKAPAAIIVIAWFLGGLNRFFTDQDRVIFRITPKRIQVCRISPFGKTRSSIPRDRVRAVRVARAEMGGGFCLKFQYRGLVRQSPEYLEHRPLEELAWFVGIIEKELKL
jgi:hypothetical protein